MSADVIPFPGPAPRQAAGSPVSEVLAVASVRNLASVVVIGRLGDGSLYVAGSFADVADAVREMLEASVAVSDLPA